MLHLTLKCYFLALTLIITDKIKLTLDLYTDINIKELDISIIIIIIIMTSMGSDMIIDIDYDINEETLWWHMTGKAMVGKMRSNYWYSATISSLEDIYDGTLTARRRYGS